MAAKDGKSKSNNSKLSADENREVDENQRLRAPVIYEIIKTEGEEELNRPLSALWWSGVAAGLAISMSVVAEGVLHMYLPDAPWRGLVESFGYCVGFLIVVLSRLQLFTENTITAVLPVMKDPSWDGLYCVGRLWLVVFAANMLGTFIFALATTYGSIFPADLVESFREISRHFMAKTPAEMLLFGIPAGFLIAAMVWMLPNMETANFRIITMMTYLIAVCGLSHVVAGSAEAFLLLVNGEIGLVKTFFGFMVPAFAGNVIGGTALFALLVYGQVREEI